jgi:hypothetical protein
MKEGVRDIKLTNILVERHSDGKNHSDSRRLDDWAKCVKKINPTSL